ncbi:MAG: hypothetical protein NC933_04260, partial [Candidatus Omnitrophica bacterium]|nr:hypothetical protein [Candidatus Omnitrophota bacterium]
MKPAPARKNISSLLVPVLLIIALGFAVYGNSITGKFVWDDEYLIKFNGFIRNLSRLNILFLTDIGAGSGRWFGFYRPLQMASYALNYRFGELDERWYHITNIVLHILAALCVMALVRTLFKDDLAAFFTSALFLVSPLQTAAVTYISGRADPLAAVFFFLALILYIRNIDSENAFAYVAMILCYAAALLSKELSLVLPLLLLLYHYSFKRKIKVWYIMPMVILPLIYIALRLTVLRYTLAFGTTAQAKTTLLQRLPGFLVAIVEYTRLLLAPVGLH